MTIIEKAKEHLGTIGPPGHAAPIEVFLRKKGVLQQESRRP